MRNSSTAEVRSTASISRPPSFLCEHSRTRTFQLKHTHTRTHTHTPTHPQTNTHTHTHTRTHARTHGAGTRQLRVGQRPSLPCLRYWYHGARSVPIDRGLWHRQASSLHRPRRRVQEASSSGRCAPGSDAALHEHLRDILSSGPVPVQGFERLLALNRASVYALLCIHRPSSAHSGRSQTQIDLPST